MQRRIVGTLCPSQVRAVAALRSGLHPRVPKAGLSAVDGTLFRGLWRIARFFDKNPAYKSLITNAYRTIEEKQDPLYTEALRAYLAGADYYVPGKPVSVPGPNGHLTTATCASLSAGDSLVDLLRMCFRSGMDSTDSWFSAFRHLSRIRALCDMVELESAVDRNVPAWLKGTIEPSWGPVVPGLVLLAHPLCEEGTWTRSVIVITGGDKPDASRGHHGWRPDGLIVNRKVREGTRELQILRDQAAFFRSIRRNKRVGPASLQRTKGQPSPGGKDQGGSGSDGEETWLSDMHGKQRAQEGAFMTVLSQVTKEPSRWQFGGPVASVEVLHESLVRGKNPLSIGPNETSIGLFHGWKQTEDTELLTEATTPRRTFVGKAAWERGQLEREMNLGVWYPVRVTCPEALRKIMLGNHELSEDDLWAAMVTESCGSPEMARLPVSAAKVVRSDLNVDWGYSSDNDDEEWGSAVASERGRGV
ncbi:hypothetical protein Pmar_PMAR003573 [Perkinsus marinus ATCC 50983]|uniref:Uncharacterized protein n=1 Tax=Perkinsus marinus (strain ATCC 50983 / TXsc) TaxID=423536 RepID=C5KHP8_PERM5|nr:hypothetical protein Pmar_PMAR003573 [Perkinsus marinus ATCC 50983]EER16110.1 hypothetical protein Pmar_PMAR003573 [Perkinsus marinus ATCC 50983]|eukprot:XP_002784314.1 hypothetical protein Pmar_PMAR003573 [Perkinsus marinus ATCC 50983]